MLNRPRSLVCANKATISTENELPRRCFLIRLPFPSRFSPFFFLSPTSLSPSRTHKYRRHIFPVNPFVRSLSPFCLTPPPVFLFSSSRIKRIRALIFLRAEMRSHNDASEMTIARRDNNHTDERAAVCPLINNVRVYPRLELRSCAKYRRD